MKQFKYITEESLEFLKRLLSTSSPSGLEMQAARSLKEYLSTFCNVEVDVLCNSYGILKGSSDFKVMICAHYDEIGIQITHIDDNGLLWFRMNGGIDLQVLAGTPVFISNGKGEQISGVIGKIPIHIQMHKEIQPLAIDDLWIDIGVSSYEEATKLVKVGDIASFQPNMQFLSPSRLMSKGLDDKIGVFIMAEVMRILSGYDHKINIYGVASAQEEVGAKGATVAANTILPHVGICVDVGVCTDTPGINKNKYGVFKLGGGPGITHNTDSNVVLTELISSVCNQENVPCQHIAGLSATGGTDTIKLQLASSGVATALIYVPNRYMHTPVEICDLNDVDNTISLIVKTILKINDESIYSFTPEIG